MLSGLLGSTKGSYIGLDIGASHIKVIGLKNNQSSRPKLIGMAAVPTPRGSVSEGAVLDFNAVRNSITEATDKAGLRLKNQLVTIGLRGFHVIYKKIVIPSQEPVEMAEQILREAQQQIDSDLNDWIIDHQILTEKDQQGQVPVMLVAGRRSIIEDLRKLLIGVGAQPVIFDCDVFAVSNIHEHAQPPRPENVLFVDIGKESTKTFLRGKTGAPTLVRTFAIGGQHLTELIAKAMSLDIEKSEVLKIATSQSGSLFQDRALATAAKSHIEEILSEIKQTIDFYSSQNTADPNERINRVVLSGGAATTAGLANALAQKFNAAVEFTDPFRSIEIPKRVKVPGDIQPHVFATSAGLALRYLGDKPD